MGEAAESNDWLIDQAVAEYEAYLEGALQMSAQVLQAPGGAVQYCGERADPSAWTVAYIRADDRAVTPLAVGTFEHVRESYRRLDQMRAEVWDRRLFPPPRVLVGGAWVHFQAAQGRFLVGVAKTGSGDVLLVALDERLAVVHVEGKVRTVLDVKRPQRLCEVDVDRMLRFHRPPQSARPKPTPPPAVNPSPALQAHHIRIVHGVPVDVGDGPLISQVLQGCFDDIARRAMVLKRPAGEKRKGKKKLRMVLPYLHQVGLIGCGDLVGLSGEIIAEIQRYFPEFEITAEAFADVLKLIAEVDSSLVSRPTERIWHIHLAGLNNPQSAEHLRLCKQTSSRYRFNETAANTRASTRGTGAPAQGDTAGGHGAGAQRVRTSTGAMASASEGTSADTTRDGTGATAGAHTAAGAYAGSTDISAIIRRGGSSAAGASTGPDARTMDRGEAAAGASTGPDARTMDRGEAAAGAFAGVAHQNTAATRGVPSPGPQGAEDGLAVLNTLDEPSQIRVVMSLVASIAVAQVRSQVAQAHQAERTAWAAERDALVDAATAERAELLAKVDAVVAERAELLAKVDAAAAERAELRAQVEAAASERAEILAKVERAELFAQVDAADSAEFLTRVDAATGERAELLTRVDAAVADQAESLTRIDAATGERAEFLTKADAATGERAEFLGKVDAAADERAELRAQVDAAARERAEFLVQFDAVAAERDELLAKVDAAVANRAELLAQVDAAVAERAELLAQVDAAARDRAELLAFRQLAAVARQYVMAGTPSGEGPSSDADAKDAESNGAAPDEGFQLAGIDVTDEAEQVAGPATSPTADRPASPPTVKSDLLHVALSGAVECPRLVLHPRMHFVATCCVQLLLGGLPVVDNPPAPAPSDHNFGVPSDWFGADFITCEARTMLSELAVLGSLGQRGPPSRC